MAIDSDHTSITTTAANVASMFLDRVQELIAENALSSTNITPALTQATRQRRRDLVEMIANFEEVNKVSYRPEKPSFM